MCMWFKLGGILIAGAGCVMQGGLLESFGQSFGVLKQRSLGVGAQVCRAVLYGLGSLVWKRFLPGL